MQGVQESMEPKKKREVIAYPAEAVLDIYQLSEWLRVSKRQAERLGIPCFYLGTRTRRYLGKTVMEFLERKIA